jgi:hypothetical protein
MGKGVTGWPLASRVALRFEPAAAADPEGPKHAG